MERLQLWRVKAACKDTDPDLFFKPRWITDNRWTAESEGAKDMCRQCEVKSNCLETAIMNNEHNGIWGGEDFDKRAVQKAYGIKR